MKGICKTKEVKTTRLTAIFGSTSDEEKVLPGIVRAGKELPSLEVAVFYASADNTPEKVAKIMAELKARTEMKVYICGAGMSNVLTGVVKTYATISDIVIGIPITDSVTHGLSSFLSTAEKPPLNPVLTVGLDNSYAALNIGYRFLQSRFNETIAVLNNEHIGKESMDELEKAFNDLNLKYQIKDIEEIKRNDVVVTIFNSRGNYINRIDRQLRNGVQICIREPPIYDFFEYMRDLHETVATGVVSIGSYKNAVQIAAQLTQSYAAFGIIEEAKQKKSKTLNDHNGVLVVNGEVKTL
ncbi:MAG: AIR carboxylase family protein [Candidatus Woesearchaeota archaeon]|nr:AIR carboxylase family protein [Candidatus Woesearchaeota archaeon]